MHSDPIFQFNGITVTLYGIFFSIGVVMALVVFMIYSNKMNMSKEAQNFYYFVSIFAIIIGYFSAILFQASYNYLDQLRLNGEAKFDIFNSGITFLGGLIGGIVAFLGATFIFGRKKYMHELKMLTQIAPCAITIAHAFGRLGCLSAGCCHGAHTDAWYGIVMNGTKYVPTQLYESLFLFALFALLSVLLFKKQKLNIGLSLYLIAYGLWRFFLEYARDDYRGTFVAGLTPSQFWCVLMVIFGVGLLLLKYYFKERKEFDFWC